MTPGFLRGLIAARESESQLLEFKSALPSKAGEESHVKFAQNVTAFANSTGGVIVYGIKTDNDRAVRESLVPLGNEVSRLNKALNSLVFPRLQSITWHERPVDDGESGFLVLDIQPSALQPHLVQEGEAFSCWRRSGKERRALSESELERAFRERAERASGITSALTSYKALARAERGSRFWFVAMPYEYSGRIWQSPEQGRRAVLEVIHRGNASGVVWRALDPNLRMRFRRLEMAPSWQEEERNKYGWSMVTDEGVFFSVRPPFPIGPSLKHFGIDPQALPSTSHVTRLFVLDSILASLVAVRELSAAFGVTGSLVMQAGLMMRVFGTMLWEPGALGIEPIVTQEDVVAQTQCSVEYLSSPGGLASTARPLFVDLMSAFGIDSTAVIHENGDIQVATLESSVQGLVREWGRRNSVRVSGGRDG